MSAARDLVAALVAGGMDPIEASSLLARAAIEMTVPPEKSSSAKRQKRYRDRNKSVTNRNETVTEQNEPERNETVTNRNETVTRNAEQNSPLTYLLTSEDKNLSEKKVSKKERVPRKRDGPLPGDWKPSSHAFEVAEEHGASVSAVEAIFRDYLKSSGKQYADYDAAFYNFLRNQRKFNGQNHGTSKTTSGGSLTASIRRDLAALEQPESADLALPACRIFRLSN